jgi:hypothetical protein
MLHQLLGRQIQGLPSLNDSGRLRNCVQPLGGKRKPLFDFDGDRRSGPLWVSNQRNSFSTGMTPGKFVEIPTQAGAAEREV